MRKKLKIYGCTKHCTKNTVLKTTDIQVLRNSILQHKISRRGGGGLLERLSVEISSNVCYAITQSQCWEANDSCVIIK